MSACWAAVDPLAKIHDGGLEHLREANGAEKTEVADTALDTADIGAIKVGAFGELFLGEVLRFAVGTDVVSEFLEGGFLG